MGHLEQMETKVCSHSLEIHASWMAPTTHPTQHVNITLTKVPLTLLAFISHIPFVVHLTQHITKLLTKVLTSIRGFNFSRDIQVYPCIKLIVGTCLGSSALA
jgi:hypothetical protein